MIQISVCFEIMEKFEMYVDDPITGKDTAA